MSLEEGLAPLQQLQDNPYSAAQTSQKPIHELLQNARNSQLDNLNENSGDLNLPPLNLPGDKAVSPNETEQNPKQQSNLTHQSNDYVERSRNQNDELFRISGSWQQKPEEFLEGQSPDISPIRQLERIVTEPHLEM